MQVHGKINKQPSIRTSRAYRCVRSRTITSAPDRHKLRTTMGSVEQVFVEEHPLGARLRGPWPVEHADREIQVPVPVVVPQGQRRVIAGVHLERVTLEASRARL